MNRLLRSFGYAFRGMKMYLRSGGNATIHIVATILVIALGLWLNISVKNWCILIIAIAMVHAAEAFNTAIEEVVNFISPQHHHLAEKIKDIAAGAVLITAIGAAIIGLLIFGQALL